MSDASILAVQATALKLLQAEVAARLDQVKAQLEQCMEPDTSQRARLLNGTKVGTVTYTAGRSAMRVSNEGALVTWLSEHYPDLIQPRVEVKPWALKQLLDASTEAGQPMMPDGTADVPGISQYDRRPYLSVRAEPGQGRAVFDYIQANLELVLMGELEGAADE